ncbi:hypothetical protein IJH89_02545 [Candidatus Saccharibacteria bacterium]|nr:hypothetical protein [Candidatus Saccharibacteria bacterium]
MLISGPSRPDLTEEDVVDAAWQLTFRVFRGGYGLNLPLRANYAFPKDHAYFAGYLYIDQQFNRGRRRAWLSTGISSRRWLEFLSSRFSLRESDLTWQNRHLSESYEFERLILDLCSKNQG